MKMNRSRMARAAVGAVALTAGWSGELVAQPAAPAAAAPAADAGVITLNLMDGSTISGTLSVKDIPIETEFGALRVPIGRIVSFTPGLDSHPDFQKKVGDLVEKLGAAEAAERDAAQRELIRMGPPISNELQKKIAESDPERKLRLAAILDEFAEAQADDDAPVPAADLIRLDAIQTPDFIVVGRIVPKTFEITSPYGPLTIKLGDVRRGSRPTSKTIEEIQKSLSVDGTHFVQLKFKESGIKVERGDKVTVKADGTITFTPWGSEAVSTPEGAGNYGWYIQNQIAMGALLCKIGKGGTVFKVGTDKTFNAEATGELQFAIAMRQGYENQAFPGKYNVKVRVRPKAMTGQ